jgi:hypothetical protein
MRSEFAQIRQKDMDKDGKLKIIPKEGAKEALGHSPDTGDTFIMRMYFELLRMRRGNRTHRMRHRFGRSTRGKFGERYGRGGSRFLIIEHVSYGIFDIS